MWVTPLASSAPAAAVDALGLRSPGRAHVSSGVYSAGPSPRDAFVSTYHQQLPQGADAIPTVDEPKMWPPSVFRGSGAFSGVGFASGGPSIVGGGGGNAGGGGGGGTAGTLSSFSSRVPLSRLNAALVRSRSMVATSSGTTVTGEPHCGGGGGAVASDDALDLFAEPDEVDMAGAAASGAGAPQKAQRLVTLVPTLQALPLPRG